MRARRFPFFTARPFECLAANVAGLRVSLAVGHEYELRCSADVLVRPGSGAPVAADLRVRPDTPLSFTCDTQIISISAATATDATVWIREVPLDFPR